MLRSPEADGTLAWDKTTMIVVTAHGGGERGLGWSHASAAAATVIGEDLAATVIGRDAFDIAGTAEAMARQVRNIGRPGVAAMAISAVDIALWDLKARLLGRSLAGLLGRARQDVPVYGSGGFTSYDDTRTRQQLSEWAEKRRASRPAARRAASPPPPAARPASWSAWRAAGRRRCLAVRPRRHGTPPRSWAQGPPRGPRPAGRAIIAST